MIRITILFAFLSATLTGLAFSDGWQIYSIDTQGFVGKYSSLVLDSLNQPHISYFDGTSFDLKYAYYDGVDWVIESVDTDGIVGEYTSIKLDSRGNPHISYYDDSNDKLKYAQWKGNSRWILETVDTEPSSNKCEGKYTSLALDSLDHPHISYYDWADSYLRYAHWDGSSWIIDTIDIHLGSCAGYTTIALDSSENPCIAYFSGIPNPSLKYAHWDGYSWQIEIVDDLSEVGKCASIAVDSTDHIHISYSNYNNGDLKYAYWDGSYWQITSVDTAGNVGWDTSITLDQNNFPHISYSDYTNGTLKYAYWDGSIWVITTIDSNGDIPLDSSIALDSLAYPHISYFDSENFDLKYACYYGNKDNSIISLIAGSNYTTSFAITSLYPNPVSDVLNITLALPEIGDVELELYDLSGRLVESQNLSVSSVGEASFKLDVSGLTNGLYTLRATQSDQQAVKQVVIVR